MKKITSFILSALTICIAFSCSNEGENEKILRQLYIDISDFTMYKGSPNGGEEVLFNTLKKKDLVGKYLSKVYTPEEYAGVTLRFNGDKLTYLESKDYGSGKQIISDYQTNKDSLFIKIKDSMRNDSLKFIALIDLNNTYYKRKGLVLYPDPKYDPEDSTQIRNKQEALPSAVDMQTVLKLAGYNSIEELTNSEDTIVWCNVIYPFN